MADLTGVALETQSDEGAAALSSDTANQKGTQGKESSPKVDLTQSAEFKKFVSERDRREAQYQQQLQQSNYAIAQLQQQLNTLADAGLDDYGKKEKELERALQREQNLLYQMQQRDEAQRIQQAKYSDLTKLATKFDLTPDQYQKLWEANDPDEAMDKAIAFRDANRVKRDEDEEERRESNKVDVGGGKASTTKSRQSGAEREAWERGDPQAYMAALLANKRKK